MKLLVRAPGRTFDDVIEATDRCCGWVIFQNRRKAMVLVDVPSEAGRRKIRQAGGETWTDDDERS